VSRHPGVSARALIRDYVEGLEAASCSVGRPWNGPCSSGRMKRILTAMAVGAAGLTACVECPNEPYPGVCNSTTCDLYGYCSFTSEQTWYAADGTVVANFDAGQEVWSICDTVAAGNDTCEQACNLLAEKKEAVGADCTGIQAAFPLNNTGECSYNYVCDSGDYPLPDPDATVVPDWDSGYYCIPDPSRAAEVAEALDNLSEFDGTGFDDYDWSGAISAAPQAIRYVLSGIGGPFVEEATSGDSCGFWAWHNNDKLSPDAICQQLCEERLFLWEGDTTDTLIWSNCDVFIRNDVCAAGAAMPGDGSNFTWQSSAGISSSPLACDEACCDDIDVGACYNVHLADDVFQVADKTTSITVPFKLNANGAITNGSLVGAIAFSAPPCGSPNATCPFYLENLALHLPAPITGTWASQPGFLKKFSGLSMEASVAAPVMGGWRPATGQFQLKALSVPIQLTTHIVTAGFPSTPVHQTVVNEKAFTGTIAAGGTVTLYGSVKLAPGIILTLGAPVQ
jgi:hypothetical protein